MKRIIAVLIVAIMAVGMTGCKESELLTKIAYDQKQQEVDQQQKVLENTEDTTEEDEHLPELKVEENDDNLDTKDSSSSVNGNSDIQNAPASSRQNTNTMEGSAAGSTTPETTETTEKTEDKKSDKNDKKTEKSGKEKKKNKDNKKKEKSTEQKKDSEENQNQNEPVDQPEDENNDQNSDKNDGPRNDGEQTEDPEDILTYDGDGEEEEIPEATRVVATGQTAILVQMLGGEGALAGTSADIAGNALIQEVFADEGIANVPVYWDGDGSTPMSDEAFAGLINDHPDACVMMRGQGCFTKGQVKKLNSEDIGLLVLPKFNTQSNIEEAVLQVGIMLGDSAESLSENYVSYCNNLAKTVKGRCGLFTFNNTDMNNDYSANGRKTAKGAKASGLFSVYIKGWDDNAFISLSIDGENVYSETGVAVAENGYSNAPVSYMMSLAGVLNNPARLSESECGLYAVIPFNVNTAHATLDGSSAGIYYPYNESFVRFWASGYGENNVAVRSGTCLGESNFPAIITDSVYTAQRISSSPMWLYYPPVTIDNGSDWGMLTVSGKLIPSYIRSDQYGIYVNPYGLSSWADGSVESILESIWVGWRISGYFTESDVTSEIMNFYQTFYRHNLTDGQLQAILGGASGQ